MTENLQSEEYIVNSSEKGMRLDVFLTQKSGDLTRSRIKMLIEQGNIIVNGKIPTKSGVILKEGDKIELSTPEPVAMATKAEDLPIEIIYEDEDLAVINKPQGMVVHAGAGVYEGTLVNALLFHIKNLSGINGVLRPGIVHRLDKNTSGLLLVAKNDKAHNSLAEQIQNKTCQREYLAILDGKPRESSGIIQTNIARSKKNRTLMAVCEPPEGRVAITEYEVLKEFEKHALVKFNLKTGRTHQIRVHCKEVLHHSITGDIEYGGKPPKNLPKDCPQSLGQYLHAYKISFNHPSSGERLTFEIPLPDYFQALTHRL